MREKTDRATYAKGLAWQAGALIGLARRRLAGALTTALHEAMLRVVKEVGDDRLQCVHIV